MYEHDVERRVQAAADELRLEGMPLSDAELRDLRVYLRGDIPFGKYRQQVLARAGVKTV